MKLRPLGELSNFVVEDLSRALEEEDPEWLSARAETLVSALDPALVWEIVRVSGENRRVAKLDVAMLETAVVHHGAYRPWKLVELANVLTSAGGAASLTYEDVVLSNPPNDMRLFTRGEIGRSELGFYTAHRLIESTLTEVIQSVLNLMDSLQKNQPIKDSMNTTELKEKLKSITDRFKTPGLMEMPKGHFSGGFRKYFYNNERRGTRGPSGAFSGQMPTLEILFRGDSPAEDAQEYVDTLSAYFPRIHWKCLKEVCANAKKGHTLEHLIKKHLWVPRIARDYVDVLAWYFWLFRATHLLTLKIQAPDVFDFKEDGTGGVKNVKEFLQDRLGKKPKTMWQEPLWLAAKWKEVFGVTYPNFEE